MNKILNIMQLLHESLVNLQTTSRINQDIVILIGTRLFQTISDNLNRRCLCTHIKNRNIDLLSQSLQLVNGCWTIDIRSNHHRTGFLFFNQLISQFTSKGCFTSPLKTNHHNDCWNLWRFLNFRCFRPKNICQFFINDLDDLLRSIKSINDFVTYSTFTNTFNECLNNW